MKRAAVLAAAFSSILVLAGCSGTDDPGPATTPSPVTPSAASPAAVTTPDQVPETGGTVTSAAPPGSAYKDPAGAYTMVTGKDWSLDAAVSSAGATAWSIGGRPAADRPSVKVSTQPAQSLGLQGYLEASVRTSKMLGSAINISKIVTTSGGQKLGVLEYQAEGPTGATQKQHLLATVVIKDDQVTTATLSAPESSFAKQRSAVEPYLLTLAAS